MALMREAICQTSPMQLANTLACCMWYHIARPPPAKYNIPETQTPGVRIGAGLITLLDQLQGYIPPEAAAIAASTRPARRSLGSRWRELRFIATALMASLASEPFRYSRAYWREMRAHRRCR